jgi:hypothetical protein
MKINPMNNTFTALCERLNPDDNVKGGQFEHTYGEDTTVTMHDMARFLAESGRKSPGAFAPG